LHHNNKIESTVNTQPLSFSIRPSTVNSQQSTITDGATGIDMICSADAVADILQQSSLVIGMTGTAVEQAVGLGKPVNAVPGNGPAFTYRFAEAQNRLLGDSVQAIGTQPANSHIIKEAELVCPIFITQLISFDLVYFFSNSETVLNA
jgi:uncharacterized protein (TIGR03492 family)